MADDAPEMPEAQPDDAETIAAFQRDLEAKRAHHRSAADPGVRGLELADTVGRLRVLAGDPEHVARVEHEDARQRAIATRALASLAASQEIPADDDLRAVALDPEPAATGALAALRHVVQTRGTGRRGCVVVVAGRPGTGKSSAAAWVLLRAETSGCWLASPDLGATPANGFSTNMARWERWLSAGFLVVDDLGTEGGDAEAVARLLWQRYNAGRLTVCTTNLSERSLRQRYFVSEIGPRLEDRLVHAQGRRDDAAHPVGAGGIDWYIPVAGSSLRGPTARAALVRRAP